jgi:hypothetical protein
MPKAFQKKATAGSRTLKKRLKGFSLPLETGFSLNEIYPYGSQSKTVVTTKRIALFFGVIAISPGKNCCPWPFTYSSDGGASAPKGPDR